MIIAHISDTHIDFDSANLDARLREFEDVIADINALDPAPDLIIHTGDIVHNGRPDEYKKAVAILQQANAPVYALVGNKDDRANMREAFSGFGFIRPDTEFVDYCVEDFPVRLIMLDTLLAGSNMGGFCDNRMQNLETMIAEDTTKPIAIFMHHPPCEISVGPSPTHFEDLEVISNLTDALKKPGRITSIFSGHVHRSTTGWVENIPVTVMTAINTALRWGDYPDHLKSRPTYYVHRYDENSGFVTETRIV